VLAIISKQLDLFIKVINNSTEDFFHIYLTILILYTKYYSIIETEN
jgi:hypothetical protein